MRGCPCRPRPPPVISPWRVPPWWTPQRWPKPPSTAAPTPHRDIYHGSPLRVRALPSLPTPNTAKMRSKKKTYDGTAIHTGWQKKKNTQ